MDLDDTLGAGLASKIGAGCVSGAWTRTHSHALYQQLLASLASTGVLIGVASRNEPRVVANVFAREDLLLGQAEVFPFELGWGPKSR